MYSIPETLAKAKTYCAYQERCQQEVRNKLKTWGMGPEESEKILDLLITGNYLNEQRFAVAYAGGKFRIKKWGRIKIKRELQKRKVSEPCIKAALTEIDDQAYVQNLKKNLEEHAKKINQTDLLKHNALLAQFAISRGFEPELVWDLLQNKT